MFFFVLPDEDRPFGGIKQAYRQVQILNDFGIRAFVLHEREGFRCSWFLHRAPIAYRMWMEASTGQWMGQQRSVYGEGIRNIDEGSPVLLETTDGPRVHRLGPNDVIVMPEFYGRGLVGCTGKLPVAIFNQGPHNTFNSYPMACDEVESPYTSCQLLGVVVSSEHCERYLRFAFPDLFIRRITYGIDPEMFFSTREPPQRTIAFMPRRLARHVQQVINILRFRGSLTGWSIMAIDGLTERETADRLRQAAVFISTCSQEGFGLPPVEAAMCGCFVVGYTGGGANEYMDPTLCRVVAQDDVLALACELEAVLREFEQRPAEIRGQALEFGQRLATRYSPERERADAISAWKDILQRSVEGLRQRERVGGRQNEASP